MSVEMSLEDLYPLSPLQQGLLFEAAAEPGMYVEHCRFRIEGSLDVSSYQRTWQRLVDRHAILRTFITHGDDGQPLQAVLRSAELPVTRLDWRGMPADQQEIRLERYCQNDRLQGFDLERAPVTRLSLIQLGDTAWESVWTFHHLLLDGWSVAKIVNELSALHTDPDHALQSPTPYRDYIAWLASRDHDAARSHWKGYLAGFTAPVRIDLPAGDAEAGALGECTHLLDSTTTARLHDTARRLGVTPNAIAQAAWAVVLGRYTDRDDIVFGTTVSGRPPALPRVEDMVGLFINTVPVRAKTHPEMPAADLIRTLQAEQFNREPYEHTPLNDIQSQSEVPSGAPLFTTLCVYENYPDVRKLAKEEVASGLLGPESRVDLRAVGSVTNYPLSVILVPGERLKLDFLFDARRIRTAVVERMVRYMAHVMGELAARPERPLRELWQVSADQRAELLARGRGPALDLSEEPVHTLIDEIAASRPEQPAVIADGGGELTYRELVHRADLLAGVLIERGVRVGDLVGVSLNRGTDLVVALLAVLKAGAAYVPLEPEFPKARLDLMVDDARPAAVIGRSGVGELFGVDWVEFVELDHLVASEEKVPLPKVDAGAAAYCLYTSGSTGRPKGVLVEHRPIVRLARGMTGVRLDPGCRMLQLAPANFDASTVEVWTTLLNGATIVVYPPETPSVAELGRVVKQHGVTTAVLATALTNSLIDTDPTALAPLRQLMVGGEAMSVPHVRKLLTHFSELEVFNGYGPTESTSFTAMQSVPRELPPDAQSVPIGRPIGGTQVYLLDRHGDLTPDGAPGELCIAGDGLARGYLNRPDLTVRAFRTNRFDDRPGARLYHSGDAVRWLPDATLDFVGRIDHQVKIRGFRVEPSETESVLLTHPDVAAAVVVPRRDETHARLIGYYTTEGGAPLTASALRDHLGVSLPGYMIPSAFVHLDRLPLTDNGKVDRAALPDPEISQPAGDYAAPRSELEAALARTWEEVLDVPRVGVHDNFLELGGDSIHAIQIVARLREDNASLTPRQIFRHPTIAELAPQVSVIDPTTEEQGLVTGALRPGPIQSWFVAQDLPRPDQFNQAVMLSVPDDLDVAALQQAVQGLLMHHDALRARARRTGGMWLAGAEAADPSQVVRISAAAGDEELAALADVAQGSLDLESGPVFRAELVTRDGRPWRLLLVIHHLAVDAVSWPLLVQDLGTAYLQTAADQSVSLPSKTSSYKKWLDHVRDHVRDPEVEESRLYWERTLAGAPLPPLPVDHSTADRATVGGSAAVRTVLPPDVTRSLLKDTSAAYRTRPDELVLTAVALAAHALGGTRELLVSMENNGRHPFTDDIDLSRTVGWFTALYPMRVVLPEDTSDLGAVIKSVKEQLRAVPQHGMSYGMLRFLHPEPLPAGHGPSLAFNFLGSLMAPGAGTDQPFTAVPEPTGTAWHPDNHRAHLLDIPVKVVEDRLEVNVVYSTAHYRAETVSALADEVSVRLRALVEHCLHPAHHGATTSDFPLAKVSQSSLDRLLDRLGK
ncbi:non-ribosomal peptide synthetase [Streptomyces liliifuscus]|uniref:Amino acid adenylation domain-containing protein n=1 Tax=Streptomyces liliifuscus TaxID=2797636 RepID=A0A7T7L4I7_9ACTN|nr:non-ribosomal peptide synthetase [Streptomyces liliifuscus]QQM46270.1 amino acid adenylation domain-containing protein [Streptomyces liliifuscus]